MQKSHRTFELRDYTQPLSAKWFSLILVLLIVFSSSLDGISRYTIRRDELTTLGHIGAIDDIKGGIPVKETIDSLILYSPEHAPLYYVIANLWGQAMDFNYFAIRILSVWFGIISGAGIY